MDIPIIQPRPGPAPARPATAFDIPILVKRGAVPGSGPNVEMQLRHAPSGTFPGDHARAQAEMRIAKGVGEMLHRQFRGHFWQVEVDIKQGVCLITIPILLGNWKYNIPLKALRPELVMRAGGEILERFNLPRSSIDVAAFCEARGKRVSRASHKPPTGS